MKYIKVFYGEERLKDIYPYASKWQVFKFKVRCLLKTMVRFLTVGSVAGGALYLAFFLGQLSDPAIMYAQTQIVDSLPFKVEALKNDVIDQLIKCESAGHKEDDGIIILDTNNRMSIGQLQFQTKTVQHYYKTLYGKTITTKEAVNVALDTDLASKLAKDIIFTTDKGLSNWINCTNKYDLKTQVKVINKLK